MMKIGFCRRGKPLALAAALFLSGCALPQQVGCYVQHDDYQRSFALSWHRDTDPQFTAPNEDPAARWRAAQ